MIRVSQGHQRGVGLEIFLKAFLCLPQYSQKKFVLYCDKESLQQTLAGIKIQAVLEQEELRLLNSILKLKYVKGVLPQTTEALLESLGDMKAEDVLLTLPSSKDQITSNTGFPFKGHTDFLRQKFQNPDITMNFLSPRLNVTLLTDHIALNEVQKHISAQTVVNKIALTLDQLQGIRKIRRVFVSGVNPHCGENGIISSFDSLMGEGLEELCLKYPNVEFQGPLPGDTILFNDINQSNLFVFAFHDQGLAPFKLMNGITGINLTLGLPFKRVSVDHGTAFDLYGKDMANYQGMLYLLNEILGWA